MAKPKEYRRFIRIQGRVISSPRFTKKRDADEWFDQMKRQKNFAKHGFRVETELTFFAYAQRWIQERVKNYPESTWRADEQRLRDYLLPDLRDIPLSSFRPKVIRETLKKVTDAGQSIETRNRVKALISKIFNDAFNEDLVPFNPVHGIKFDDSRQGKAKPEYLRDDSALKFLAAAREMTPTHEFIALCGLFLGLRKSEIIPLKESDFDFKRRMVTVSRRFEQASNSVRSGTKAGEKIARKVPIPTAVVEDFSRCIVALRNKSEFILCGSDRPYLPPRVFHDRFMEIANRAQVKTSSHKLRHTFGREFVRNGGDIKALQAILGHSVSVTTDRYSNLDGEDIAGRSDVVSYGVKTRADNE